VYNAIIDGTDAVMLSNESASGQYPLEAVETMATIAAIAEQNIWQNRGTDWAKSNTINLSGEAISDAISEATYYISEALNPRAVVTVTQSGYTARRVACERPRAPIVCVTPNPVAYRQMALVWGVIPILIPNFNNTDEMLDTVSHYMIQEGYANRGDTVIVIASVPFGGAANQTNFLKVHTIDA
jgi:pyruvate kinase